MRYPPLYIESPDLHLLVQKDHSLSGARPDLIRFFRSVFFSSLALALAFDGQSAEGWLAQLPSDTWIGRFCHFLIESALDLSTQLKCGQLPSSGWICQKASTLQAPGPESSENDRRFYGHATSALEEIALDLHLLARLRGGPAHISRDQLDQIVKRVLLK